MNELKKNLLFISCHLPSDTVPQAGQAIILNNLNFYKNKYHVYLMTFVNDQEKLYLKPDMYNWCTDYNFFFISNITRIISAIKNPYLPLRIVSRVNKTFTNRLIRLNNKIKFDRVHIEYTAGGYYIPYLLDIKERIVVKHDVVFQGLQRYYLNNKGLKRKIYKYEYKRQKLWEIENLKMFTEICVLSDKDYQLLKTEGIPDKLLTIKYPKTSLSLEKINRKKIIKHTLLFWGAMNRKENYLSILWFIKDVFPIIKNQIPECKLYIVGANPPKRLKEKSSEDIIITGYIENPIYYFQTLEIAIAPLLFGAGIKIKVLEALAANMKVVATSIGGEGIKNKNLFIANNPVEFADKIFNLLTYSNGNGQIK